MAIDEKETALEREERDSKTYLLQMLDICKSFPGVKALDHAQLKVRPGTVHSLMGENGAGKSTLMKCLFGLYTRDSGDVIFNGRSVTYHSTKEALEDGIAMVQQELNQAQKMSVMDNLWLGRYPMLGGFMIDSGRMFQMTTAVFQELGIDYIDPNAVISSLSVADRQMIEIAKAVSYNAKIVVFDEPTSSLSDNEIRKHIYFYRRNEIGVEVKSWISEIVRVFFDRKYGIKMPEKLTPRHFSIFQTRYFLSPSLLKKSDKIYREYMQKFDLASQKFNYEHTDLYYWEVRMSNWGMMVTASLDICHRITFPFNNRRLMVLLLSLPREKRVTDEVHSDIIRLANPTIYETHEHVQNKYFKSKRILLEKVYYKYRTIFYKDRG